MLLLHGADDEVDVDVDEVVLDGGEDATVDDTLTFVSIMTPSSVKVKGWSWTVFSRELRMSFASSSPVCES